jgi:transposase-like protein
VTIWWCSGSILSTRSGSNVILADRGSGDQYVISVKAANESTIRLLLADRQQESLTVYTDGFLRFRFEKCTSKFRGRTNGDILGP